MQLLELSANKSTFKRVTFLPTGVNLIIGRKSKDSGPKDTFNGVGKSLLIEIINFCLGSSNKKAFKESLDGWEFTLKFLIDSKTYIVTRGTGNQSYVIFNERKVKTTTYTKELGKMLFKLDEDLKNLTFRALISLFIRTGKLGYSSYKGKEKKDFETNLKVSYLLGLDYHKVIKKSDLKTKLDGLRQSKALFEENETLKSYYSKEIDIDLADLDQKINDLETNLKKFQVAEDYHEIRSKADSVSQEIKEIANKEFTLENALKNIKKSLQIEPDLDKEQVLKLYEQARIEIGEAVKRNIGETINFHNSLISERRTRLTKENNRLQSQLNELQKQRKSLSEMENGLLKYLSTKGALEEFTSLSVQLSNWKYQREKLTQYSSFLEKFEQEKAVIKASLALETSETEEYLNSSAGKNTKEENLKFFQKLAKEFYKDKAGGITIQNNTGENQIRYNIDVKIPQDQSDGIDEVKIFCFDLLILLTRHNHQVKTLVHDSRLFSNMDPRQQATALRVALDYSQRENCQYIATLNENMLEGIREALNCYDYKDVYSELEKKIILNLTDESAENKLLGINIDLDYDS